MFLIDAFFRIRHAKIILNDGIPGNNDYEYNIKKIHSLVDFIVKSCYML